MAGSVAEKKYFFKNLVTGFDTNICVGLRGLNIDMLKIVKKACVS